MLQTRKAGGRVMQPTLRFHFLHIGLGVSPIAPLWRSLTFPFVVSFTTGFCSCEVRRFEASPRRVNIAVFRLNIVFGISLKLLIPCPRRTLRIEKNRIGDASVLRHSLLGITVRATSLPDDFVVKAILPKQFIKNCLGVVAHSRI